MSDTVSAYDFYVKRVGRLPQHRESAAAYATTGLVCLHGATLQRVPVDTGKFHGPARFPTLAAGTRVQHLGSPQCIGTVESSSISRYAFDPCHVELTVRWDDDSRSLCGINSVRVLP